MKKTFTFFAALLFVPAALADQKISESADASPDGKVEIFNVAGSVDIEGWDRHKVQVTGTLGSGAERLKFEVEGGHTLIKVLLPHHSRHAKGSDLVIKIPHSSSLTVTTVSAEVEVDGISGAQRLQSVSGDVETTVESEDTEVKTVSGDIEIGGNGDAVLLTVNTVSGDADIERVGGEIVAASVSGDLTVLGAQVERARMKTTSGDLTLRAHIVDGARLDLESLNGDVELMFENDVNAEFDIETFNGDIDNCFGPSAVRTSKYAPGWELRFEEGDGSTRVRIETLNGTIEICRD